MMVYSLETEMENYLRSELNGGPPPDLVRDSEVGAGQLSPDSPELSLHTANQDLTSDIISVDDIEESQASTPGPEVEPASNMQSELMTTTLNPDPTPSPKSEVPARPEQPVTGASPSPKPDPITTVSASQDQEIPSPEVTPSPESSTSPEEGSPHPQLGPPSPQSSL